MFVTLYVQEKASWTNSFGCTFVGEGECEGEAAEVVVVSLPLQRVKAISEASEVSDASSVNSQGWEDTGEGKHHNNLLTCHGSGWWIMM